MEAETLEIGARIVPVEDAARFHLLMAHGGDQADFVELVAANEQMERENDWWACVENPLDVSSVEADARLARWSRRTGELAVRITRADPHRWWLAVHHAGERLMVMVHNHGNDRIDPASPVLVDLDLGRDPLLDILKRPSMTVRDVRRAVADHRAEQLSSALGAGGVSVPADYIARILGAERPKMGNLPPLLDQLGVPSFLALARPDASAIQSVSAAVPTTIQRVVTRAVVTGCVIPGVVAVAVFVILARYASKAGVPPAMALILGAGAAWLGSLAVREVTRRVGRSGGQWHERMMLAWAADAPIPNARAIRPTAPALDTWGGLFYLLRDIAFFGGIDRPRGPMALYIEAYGLGPPALVETINRVSAEEIPAEALFGVAQSLVDLRRELIDRHLEGDTPTAEEVAGKVRGILRPAISRPPPIVAA